MNVKIAKNFQRQANVLANKKKLKEAVFIVVKDQIWQERKLVQRYLLRNSPKCQAYISAQNWRMTKAIFISYFFVGRYNHIA